MKQYKINDFVETYYGVCGQIVNIKGDVVFIKLQNEKVWYCPIGDLKAEVRDE